MSTRRSGVEAGKSSSICTVILTFNEEIHIARSIESAWLVSDDILVVDSFSTDRTVEIARAKGARVIQNAFVNHSRQFNFGLEAGNISASWILRLDADEYIGPDLAARINSDLSGMPDDVAGIAFNRRHIFMDRWVRHGGRYPLYLVRLWRNGQGRVEDRWMDEHVLIHGGRTIKMEGEFADASQRDLAFFVKKHDGYAAREAIEVLNRRHDLFEKPPQLSAKNNGWQASFKRLLKERFYNQLPLGMGPLSYFLYRYFLQFGFLDGKSGLIYHFLQGFWYRFLVEAKAYEFERAIADCESREEKLEVLRSVSGLKL
ncbi:glycosyltransferase family 2 protein [Sphingosinithalassobacter tenebrarum]|uniref:Glycosyltransferase family 2 protein n=1 Tax=Stakelama tenebrarum TaxID=2711215 RepID=A0A6G6YAF1_9SPHN|nr:glycosyltransferase family 2 protein [Sphingosinithalassobacter tenebrarum]